ncbi:hypothetical protein JNUCC0626_50345 (plasmid) [Lentzea sp. JNUCC 0626]|uniref:hypothetical protein n=1 Tax=Lentzea sp. JNUCC 0626 TaxID=3367513 RepID=UPI0037484D56
MSRSSAMRTLAWTLTKKTGVQVEPTYDNYRGSRCWYLTWSDGPCEATMRKRVAAAARGVASIDVKELRYLRNKTELNIVVAFLAYVLPRPEILADPPWDALYAYNDTDFPGERDDPGKIDPAPLDPEAWDLARFAISQFTDEDRFPDGRETIRHIVKIGLNGLRLDHWLSQIGRQSDCRLLPPAVNTDVVSERVQQDLASAINHVQAELVGGSAHRNDPRVQLLVAETTRKLLLKAIDQQQLRTTAHALADGSALGPLSTAIGLSTRTLGMRFGKELDDKVAPLTWLRDHATEWAHACTAVARAAKEDPSIRSDARRVLWTLENADPAHGWRDLLGTIAAARTLLDATRRWPPKGASAEPCRHLEELLAAHDQAPPPGRRERALRRAFPSKPADTP